MQKEKMTKKEKIEVIILITVVMLLLILVCTVAIIDSIREDKANNPTEYTESPYRAINEQYIEYLPENALHPITNECTVPYDGPSGYEDYYNVPMDSRIEMMRELGYTENEYPYYIRDDGCKMLGNFIMVAMDSNTHKMGDIVDTSLGKGIVVDWMGSCYQEGIRDIDLATAWY